MYKDGMLPKHQVFSIFYDHHRDEAIALFHVLFFANDWDTFYKTACWAREHVNEGMFIYAMHASILHRKDTQGLILPAIYEINPYYFVNSEVIDKAYTYKMKHDMKDYKTFTIDANYTGWYMNNNPTMRDMAYFTEDVDMNALYFYFNMDYPFWMSGEEYGLDKDRRGELFYWFHQQILAKYYLERLSNNHGSIHIFDWEEPIKTGFVPTMRYHNGLEFPTRPAWIHLMYNPHNQHHQGHDDNVFRLTEVEDFERRIRDAIDFGAVFTEDGTKIDLYSKDGFNMLGKIIEGGDSPNTRFYGVLQAIAHKILGYSPHPHDEYKVVPSAMEHFETCMRDPIFFQFYKRILHKFFDYKRHLPHYKHEELMLPGVKIEKVDFDKLVTFMDHYTWEMTNALYFTEEEFLDTTGKFQVHVRQMRLNHKPFTMKIATTSEKDMEVMIKVFIGPKYDEMGHHMHMEDNWMNFVQMDQFHHKLTSGKNLIERNSREAHTAKDRTPARQTFQHILKALKGEEEFHLDMTEAHNELPTRFMLPKGKPEGMEFQIIVAMYPYKPLKHTYDTAISAGVGSGNRYMDNFPMGYPLDRPVDDEHSFFVPNIFMEDVMIYHKTEEQIQKAH